MNKRIESVDQFIGVYDNYFRQDYINDVIKYFESMENCDLVQPSSTNKIDKDMDEMFFNDPTTVQKVPPYYSQYFFKVLFEELWPLYTKEFGILGNYRMTGTTLKMKKIKPGGGFHSWRCETLGSVPERQVVAQLYLNDIKEGGETEFLYQSKRIQPKENRMLLWPASWTHTHRGNPPLGDESKYILTTWLEENPHV